MAIFYIQYEAVPLPESEDFDECGGAYINCWLEAESKEEASMRAFSLIQERGWEIVSVEEECHEVTDDFYSENKDGREHYNQAVTDGECYVFHQWPVGAKYREALEDKRLGTE